MRGEREREREREMQNQNRNMEFDMGGKLIFSRERNFFRNDIHFLQMNLLLRKNQIQDCKQIFMIPRPFYGNI